MGLRSSVHWLGWFITKLVLVTVTVTLLTFIMLGGDIIQFSDPVIVWMILMLYGVSTVLFAFMVSTFFGSARLASACGGLLLVFVDLSLSSTVLFTFTMLTGTSWHTSHTFS